MTLSRPLVWKEWAESKTILFIGAIVFLVLPLIGALERIIQYGRFEIWTSPWVVGLGGVLAVVAGVGIIIPDVAHRFEFIRSQPIPLARWLLVKYLTGLVIILITLCVPLALECLVDHSGEFSGFYLSVLLLTLPFTWTAIYSISFVAACLIRRTALSVIVGVFVLLVIYFLPPMVPALEILSLNRVTSDLGHVRLNHNDDLQPGIAALHPSFFVFATTFLIIAGLALLLAIAAIKRDWQVESNRKSIAWALAIFLLAPLASASLQLGTNMPLLQTVSIDDKERPQRFVQDGNQALLFTSKVISAPGEDMRSETFIRRVTTGPQLELGPRISLGVRRWWGAFAQSPAPDVLYSLTTELAPDPRPEDKQFDPPRAQYPVLRSIRLLESSAEIIPLEMKDQTSIDYGPGEFVFKGSTMLVISGKHELSFNISDPPHPRLLSAKQLSISVGLLMPDDRVVFKYPTECDVPVDDLIAAHLKWQWWGLVGDTQTLFHGVGKFNCYSRADAAAGMVNFNRVGRYAPLPIERYFDRNPFPQMSFKNGLLATGGRQVSLFDVTDPSNPRRIGHYASPLEQNEILAILPDGRVVATNSKGLIVLGKP